MKEGYIFIGENIFHSLFAVSELEQQKGLMMVSPPTPTMTFIYDHPRINKFWMHQTPAPLDILFVSKGELVQICRGEPFSTQAIGDNRLTDLVVELPAGTVFSSNIKLGSKVGLVSPSLQELLK